MGDMTQVQGPARKRDVAPGADNWRLLWSSGSDFHARVPEETLMPVPHIYGCPLGKHVFHRLSARGDL